MLPHEWAIEVDNPLDTPSPEAFRAMVELVQSVCACRSCGRQPSAAEAEVKLKEYGLGFCCDACTTDSGCTGLDADQQST